MGKVGTGFSMSLDGFVADENDQVGPLFNWYNGGSVEINVPMGEGVMPVKFSPESAAVWREAMGQFGALVTGRHLFELTQGWGGRHPLDVPIFVVTHRPPSDWVKPGQPFTFVDNLESAIAQAQQAAGDKDVSIAPSTLVHQALKLGLLDMIQVDLVPVLFGKGVRAFKFDSAPVELEIARVVDAPGVTHITYNVVRK